MHEVCLQCRRLAEIYHYAREIVCLLGAGDRNQSMGLFFCLNSGGFCMVWRNARAICERKTLFPMKKNKRIKSDLRVRERANIISFDYICRETKVIENNVKRTPLSVFSSSSGQGN